MYASLRGEEMWYPIVLYGHALPLCIFVVSGLYHLGWFCMQ